MRIYQWLKRCLDTVFSLLLIIALFPVFAVVIALQLAMEGRPVFYFSKRYVSVDREVLIPKFRTMVPNANTGRFRLDERFMRDGYLDIPLSCEVYTRFGRILERTQLVETLQVLNILKGEMSFIGNRPLPLRNIELLKQMEDWQKRFDSPAGISGISQVVGKYGLEPKQRLQLECMYSSVYRNGNVIKCDLAILYYTARLLLTGKTLSYDRAISLMMGCMSEK